MLPPTSAGNKRYRDLSVRLSVPWRRCPRRATAPGYRHAGCLQLSHVRTADPSADGRRSAASRTAIGGGISSRRPGAMTCWLTPMARSRRRSYRSGQAVSTPSPCTSSYPFPSPLPIPLEVGPLYQLGGLGKCCKLPQRGLRQIVSQNRIEFGAF